MRPLVAVAMGGYSSEFGISLLSGSHVFDVLDPVRYDPVRLELSKQSASRHGRFG